MTNEMTGGAVGTGVGSYVQNLRQHYRRVALRLRKEPAPEGMVRDVEQIVRPDGLPPLLSEIWRIKGALRVPYDGHQMSKIIVRAAVKIANNGVTEEKVFSPSRSPVVCEVRYACMWRLKNKRKMTMTLLADIFDRDRHSVLYGLKQHEKRK